MISKEEVLALAGLARLKLADAEVGRLQKDISNILDYVGQISSVPAGEKREKPALRNVVRDDVPRPMGDPLFGKEEALRAAFPRREGEYDAVRKILQKDE